MENDGEVPRGVEQMNEDEVAFPERVEHEVVREAFDPEDTQPS